MTTATAVVTGFTRVFGSAPEAVFSAPGRVNLIGEHTDYNEGLVLPAAIDRRIFLAVRGRTDSRVRVVAGDLGDSESIWDAGTSHPIERDARLDWANYLRGVCEQFRRMALKLSGIDVYVHGNMPPGTGLGSSAALSVGFAIALDGMNALGVGKLDMARWCQAAEHEYLGTRCGIMDQLASLLGRAGHALLIDCRSLTAEPVKLPDDAVILVVESGQSHRHAGGRYNERRAECEAAARRVGAESLRDVGLADLQSLKESLGDVVFRRARHILTENERTRSMAASLSAGDYSRIGYLMAESQASMRDDFEITTPEIEALVALLVSELAGKGGARMTGGGFGGSVVVLAPRSVTAGIDERVVERYREASGLQARIHRCESSDGARREGTC